MKRTLALLIVLLVTTAVACGGGGDDSGDGGGDGGDGGELQIYAVEFVQTDLEKLAEAYEAQGGATIGFTFGGAPDLLTQIGEGADADLFVGTDRNVEDLDSQGDLVGDPVLVGQDVVQIVTPAGNPGGVTGLDAFGDSPIITGVCAADTSCGTAAEVVLRRAGITPAPDSTEPTAGDLADKVASGELQAGILWRTQSQSRGENLVPVALPEDQGRVRVFDIGTVTVGGDVDDFLAWLETDEAQAILIDRGLQAPNGDAG